MMKRIVLYLVLASAVMLAFTACKEKKQSDDIIVTKYVPEQPQAPIRMSVDARNTDVTWQGKPYVVSIERVPADSLPMVADETGQKYVDNSIRLSVLRADGSVFLHRAFTKGSFASYLDSNYVRKGLLDNMVFHEVNGGNLRLAVIVSLPGSDDEFIPLDLNLDVQGGLSIRRANLLEEGDRGDDYASEGV